MRQVRLKVNAYEKALVFKNGQLVRVLDSGKYWMSPWVEVVKYDVTELFYHEIDLDLLMECEGLSSRVDILEVADTEIAVQYKNGKYNAVLPTGRYTFWKDGLTYTYEMVDLTSIEVDERFSKQVLTHRDMMPYTIKQIVENYEVGLLYVDGVFQRELSPGTYYFWKGAKNIVISKIDKRQLQVEVSGQELLTLDKAAIRMSLFASYRVVDVLKAMTKSKDYSRQLYVTLQLALREYVGQYTLDQLLRNKISIAPFILEYAKERATELGVKIIDCGVRDIILPADVKHIMNQVLMAEKKAQANTIMRREETASTRSLLNTAKLMEDNDMLFKLKEMEYMEKIADKIGEITINGGSRVVDQLKTLVGSK